jgi:hypothetical protein
MKSMPFTLKSTIQLSNSVAMPLFGFANGFRTKSFAPASVISGVPLPAVFD